MLLQADLFAAADVGAFTALASRFVLRTFRGYRQKEKDSSGPRGQTAFNAFTPVIGGWGFMSILIAFITFGYFFVQYRLVPDYLVPAELGFLELVGGLSLAAVLVKVRVQLDRWGALTVILAGVATAVVLSLEILIQGFFPASGQTASSTIVVLNPYAEVLFYYSQGVAEACAWVLFVFTAVLKAFHSFAYALAISSVGFMVYHLGVVNIVYMGAYWSSLPFLATIFAGNIAWSTLYYFRPTIGVVSWSHGMLNVVVTALGLLGLISITFSGVSLPTEVLGGVSLAAVSLLATNVLYRRRWTPTPTPGPGRLP